MAKCKGCGAEIVWLKTAGGKAMPCDPDPVPYLQQARAKEKVVTPNGEVLSCHLDIDPKDATGVGYIPHWATCPAAKKFK